MTARKQVEEIYEAERGNIYSYLLYWGVPPERAQDLAQEVFLKLFSKMSKGEKIENPRGWLYRVAHHAALRFHTREPVFDRLDAGIESLQTAPSPESQMIEQQRRAALVRAIRDLSSQQRHCLHLRGQGLRYREIAEVAGISISAASEFIRRAVTRLKETLDG